MMIIQQTPEEIQEINPTDSATLKNKKDNERVEEDLETCTLSAEGRAVSVATPVEGLNCFDVICGRCSFAFNNVGNRRFRIVIALNLQRYIDAPTRPAKGKVILSVVRTFQEELGAKFVKQTDDGDFVPVSSRIVRQKVGHALRDLAAQQKAGDDNRSLPNCGTARNESYSSRMLGITGKHSNSSHTNSELDLSDHHGDRSISSTDLSTQSEPVVSRVPSIHCSSFLSTNMSMANQHCDTGTHEDIEKSPVYSMEYCGSNFFVNGGCHVECTEQSNSDHIDDLVDKVLLVGQGVTRESFDFDCTPIPL